MGESWRCFVGLPLPQGWGAALDRVAGRLSCALASRISWTRPGNWHLTLKFLGEVERVRLPEAARAMQGVAFDAPLLALGEAGGFLARGGRTPGVLWAGLAHGADACARLAAQVDAALAAAGFPPQSRPFRAHVTLGRVKAAHPGDDWSIVERELFSEAFAPGRAREMVLWRSILGPDGPKYLALKVVPARDHGGCPEAGDAG
jgi:2'-5' RNA ligase